jgi:hypothetical protein
MHLGRLAVPRQRDEIEMRAGLLVALILSRKPCPTAPTDALSLVCLCSSQRFRYSSRSASQCAVLTCLARLSAVRGGSGSDQHRVEREDPRRGDPAPRREPGFTEASGGAPRERHERPVPVCQGRAEHYQRLASLSNLGNFMIVDTRRRMSCHTDGGGMFSGDLALRASQARTTGCWWVVVIDHQVQSRSAWR